MAKTLITVNGTYRNVKDGFITVDGEYRRIKDAYITVNGVYKPVWSSYDPVFANNTWEQIAEACRTRQVPDTWAVGDQKVMTIGGTDYLIDIIGKDHDDYADGSGKAPLTFQLHDCYGTKYKMQTYGSNNGGWTNCLMRSEYIPRIFNLLPTIVQNSIRDVVKMTSKGNLEDEIVSSTDKLFLLSEIEVFGKRTYSKAGEGEQYSYYKTHSVLKGEPTQWWNRSPGNNNFTYCVVHNTGVAITYDAGTSLGVSFAFCF